MIKIINFKNQKEINRESFLKAVDKFKEESSDTISAYALIAVDNNGDIDYAWHGKCITLIGAIESAIFDLITEMDN